MKQIEFCHRIDCNNTVSGRKFYCSKRCSSLTRNRRYWNTFAGRRRKRATASRYFQRHRYDIYAKRAARFEKHVADVLSRADATMREDLRFEALMSSPSHADMSRFDLELLGARQLVRVQRDWHGRAWGDTALGRAVWRCVDPDSFVRQTSRRAPGPKPKRADFIVAQEMEAWSRKIWPTDTSSTV